MGLSAYSIVWKNCATCRSWGGERKANAARNGVMVDSSAAGTCNGFWQGSRKYGNNKCPEWHLWPDLNGQAEDVVTYP